MSQDWRRKGYYHTRVLIPVADVLGDPRPDMLICLTGVQASLLRNACEYLHRRSTFVSEYHDGYYLAPTDQEWDEIEGIVADTEDILMGCEDYLALLQCICDGVRELKGVNWPAGGQLDGQPDYDDYTSPVEYEVGDPPGEFEDWDDWQAYVCKAAQHVLDDATDLSAKLELLYTTGAAITFSAFQALIIGSAVAPPVALVLAIVEVLLILGTALSVNAVEEWIGDHKQALVCAIYSANTVAAARSGIAAVVAEFWDLVMAPAFLYYMLSDKVLSSIFDGTVPDYQEWQGEYTPGYCVDCQEGEDLGEGYTLVPCYVEAIEYAETPFPNECHIEDGVSSECTGNEEMQWKYKDRKSVV